MRKEENRELFPINLKGSYTIEAALLTPFFVGIVILVIYLGMYFYDVSALQAMAEQSAQKAAANQNAKRKAAADEVKRDIQKNSRGSLFFARNVQVEVSVSGSETRTVVSGNMKIPAFYIINKLVNRNDWKIKLSARASITNPVEFIRKVRVVENAGRIQEKSE